MTKTIIERTEKRKNRFTGESIMLTKEEAKRHDAIFLCEVMATLEDKELGYGGSKIWDTMREHLNYGIRYEPISTGLQSTMLKLTWSY